MRRITNAAMPGEEDDSGQLTRDIGLFGATSLGLGAMIGAGVFVLSGMAAGTAGPAMILVFALNGLIAIIVGACYAELATMFPRAGGAYIWAKPAFGSFIGFYAGWMSWFAQTIAGSLYAAAFGSFAAALIQSTTGVTLGSWFTPATTVTVLIAFLLLNYQGSRSTGVAESIIVSLKVMVLLVVVAYGLAVMAGKPDPMAAFVPFFPEGLMGVWGAMGLTFIAFEGYEIIAQSAEEVRDPSRTIPRAIFGSIIVAVVIYLLIAVVLFGAVNAPPGQSVYQYLGKLGEQGLMEAGGQFVPGGQILLLIAGLASTASALNATVYGSTRVALAMGREGDLPGPLSRVHPVHHTPHVAIAVTGAVMILVTLILPLRDIAASTNIMFLLVFAIVCATVIRLRSSWADRPRPFRVPLSPWLPCIGIAAGLGLSVGLIQLSVPAWITAGIWLAAGLVAHLLPEHL